jgi:hypothetical protein
MKLLLAATAAAAMLAFGTGAGAEVYKDYTPLKGAWQFSEIHVDPNHIDDYLVGLKTSWATGQEIDKKRGIIDNYAVMVRIDAGGKGANVILARHLTSLASLEPDKARDQAIQAENFAVVPKAKQDTMVAGYEKYREFVGEGFYQIMEFTK